MSVLQVQLLFVVLLASAVGATTPRVPVVVWGSGPEPQWVPRQNMDVDLNSLAALLDQTVLSSNRVGLVVLLPDHSSTTLSLSLGAYGSKSQPSTAKELAGASWVASFPSLPTSQSPVDVMRKHWPDVKPTTVRDATECQNLLTDLSAGSGQTTSRQRAIVSVQDYDTSTDGCLHQLIKASTAPQSQMAAMLMSQGSVYHPSLEAKDRSIALMEQTATLGAASEEGTVKFISSTILFGLMLMFFLVFALLVGACCLLGVQTPLRFPSRKLAVNKEF